LSGGGSACSSDSLSGFELVGGFIDGKRGRFHPWLHEEEHLCLP